MPLAFASYSIAGIAPNRRAQTPLLNNCLTAMFDALTCLTLCPTKAPVVHLDTLLIFFYQREADRDGLTSTILQPL